MWFRANDRLECCLEPRSELGILYGLERLHSSFGRSQNVSIEMPRPQVTDADRDVERPLVH